MNRGWPFETYAKMGWHGMNGEGYKVGFAALDRSTPGYTGRSR